MSKKTDYLIETFFRARNKKYESYVINSIWNKLDNDKIKPVTQQYIVGNDGKRRYIDLYFPQLNIGVEVDEHYHSNSNQSENDKIRTLSIFDYFNKVEVGQDYIEYRIQVYDNDGNTKSFDELNDNINFVVDKIKHKLNEIELKAWITDVEEFILNNRKLTTKDDIIFKRIIDVANKIFGKTYKDWRKGLIPNHLWDNENKHVNTDLWFPKLAIEIEGNLISANNDWNNQIDEKGNVIEFQESKDTVINPDFYEDMVGKENDRYVFVRSKDIYGQTGYKFIGKYRKTHLFAKEHNGIYKKASFFVQIDDAIIF